MQGEIWGLGQKRRGWWKHDAMKRKRKRKIKRGRGRVRGGEEKKRIGRRGRVGECWNKKIRTTRRRMRRVERQRRGTTKIR